MRVARAATASAPSPSASAAGTSSPGTPTDPAPAADQDGLAITLDAVSPRIARNGSVLRIAGRVRNTGTAVVEAPAVRLRFSNSPLVTRGEVAEVAAGGTTKRIGIPLRDTESVLRALRPGASARFAVRVPVEKLGLRGFGVYVVGVESGDATRGFERLGLLRTFLPWAPPRREFQPTRVVWLWPLVDAVHRDGADVFTSERLTGRLRPGGRLGRLLATPAGEPVTWVVDPMLLEDATAMAQGYRVRRGDTVTQGRGAAAAAQWLAALNRAMTVAGTDVAALPYASVDGVALHRGGLDKELRRAATVGPGLAREVLDRAVHAVAWPAGGTLDRGTAAVLHDAGVWTFLLAETAKPLVTPLTYTADARTMLDLPHGEQAQAVVYDTGLSALVAAPTGGPGARVLAQQRFLAESAMVTAEAPSIQRTVVVAPPPRWDPDPAYARALVSLTAAAPWTEPTSLSQAMADTAADMPTTSVTQASRRPLTFPRSAARAALPPAYIAKVRSLVRELTAFGNVLTDPEPLLTPLERANLRLGSTAWRGRRTRADLLELVGTQLAAQTAKVSLLPTTVTVGSSRAIFPVTVQNELDQPVRVQVELVPRSPKLRVQRTRTVTVAPEQKKQLTVPVRALANGVVPVRARLRNAEGKAFGRPVELEVRVAQYGPIAAWVTGIAAGVLFLAALRRAVRRVRAGRRTPASGAEATS
ncbi:MAG: DUF6049 family protein [Actinomycetota bacterium]|nr:DUF6049 family protein [Actinomycetota bacterium]